MSTADPILVSDDAGPKIAGTIWALVVISGIFLALRLYVKATVHRHIWWDDSFLLASWVMMLTTSAINTYGISEGFGRHIGDVSPRSVIVLNKLISVSAVFSLLGAAWSKTSFALTLMRVTEGNVRMAIWIIIGTLNAALTVNAILPFARCVPTNRGWNPLVKGTCWFDPDVAVSYSMFAGAYSAAMDFLLALVPWAVVLHLNMKTKDKIGVAVCMSLGFVAGATAIVRVTKIPLFAHSDFSFEAGELAIWTVAELATTVMAASIPVLRPLIIHGPAAAAAARRRLSSVSHPYRRSAPDGLFFAKGPPPRPYGTAAHAVSTICTSDGRPAAPKRSPSRALSRRDKKAKAEAKESVAETNDEGGIVRVQTVAVAYDVRTLRDSMRSIVSPAVPPAAATLGGGGGFEMGSVSADRLPPRPVPPKSKLGQMMRRS